MEKERKKRIETSKLILLVLFLTSTIFVIFNMYLSYINHNTSVMEIIADGLFKLFTIAVGFYYWKAKNENIQKGKKEGKIKEYDDVENHYDPYDKY